MKTISEQGEGLPEPGLAALLCHDGKAKDQDHEQEDTVPRRILVPGVVMTQGPRMRALQVGTTARGHASG